MCLDFHIDYIMETVCNLLVMGANEIITILFTSGFLKSWYKTLAFSLSKTLSIDYHCIWNYKTFLKIMFHIKKEIHQCLFTHISNCIATPFCIMEVSFTWESNTFFTCLHLFLYLLPKKKNVILEIWFRFTSLLYTCAFSDGYWTLFFFFFLF